ncbi:MAG: signal peptidase I [Candidatus Eisenbacteria sp.]|nr:signal peptidase I [Candidatus Eisenbacteria bacterium]
MKDEWRAGFVERVGAFSLDLLLIVWTYTAGLHVLVGLPLLGGTISFLKGYLVLLAGLGALSMAYFTVFNSQGRQTAGKWVFGIRAVRDDRSPISLKKGFFRSLCYLFSEGVLYVGFLWALWDRKRQAWHDKLVGTVVEVIRPQTAGTRLLALLCFLCLLVSSTFPSATVKSRFRAFTTPTSSMVWTLLPGDYFIADLGFMDFADVARGDIIVFAPPNGGDQAYIKRCVALGGQHLEVRRNMLILDGESVPEPYIYMGGIDSPYANWGPLTVPRDSVYVMGDNRDNSLDSRYFGFLDKDLILGRADVIYWSMEPDTGTPRVERVGRRIE